MARHNAPQPSSTESPKHSALRARRVETIYLFLESLRLAVATYAIPLMIGLVSLLAMLYWKAQYPSMEGQHLQLQVVQSPDTTMGPEQMRAQLGRQPAGIDYETKLSESPVWFSFAVENEASTSPQVLEFPSRHAMDISCWDADSLKLLGSGNRKSTEGDIAPVKAGYALDISKAVGEQRIICRTTAVGPARISVLQWSAADLDLSSLQFHRRSGLLDGGMLILALFVILTAIINRNGLYMLFAIWLAVNLRMAELSAGWDTQWLGNTVPQDWLMAMRPVTLAMFYALTLELFKRLFREELKAVGSSTLLAVVQWISLPLLFLSVALPYRAFLPIIWGAAGLGVVAVVTLLVKILKITRSRVAMWYGVSITVTLTATLYEVLAAALGTRALIGSINSVTAALSSSLLAALAVAQHMRQEHELYVAVQAKLTHTYDAMPIGLFTLDQQGRFLRANPALTEMLGANVNASDSSTWVQYFGATAWASLLHMVQGSDENELEVMGRAVPMPQGRKRYLVKATLAYGLIEGSLQDVTERALATAHLQFLANHDSLTEVMNRRAIAVTFEVANAGMGDAGSMALAYLDLDRFKLINDLYGHSAGDEVLQLVCARVQGALGGGHTFGRVGGDEFVVVFANSTIEQAEAGCRRVLSAICTEPYRVGNKALNLRGSIGLIEVSPSTRFNDALSAADRACRQAKTGSSGGLVVYKQHAIAFEQHEAELRLIAMLATSSVTDGLYLEMQPIMSLTSPAESLDFEVLLRMRDSDGAVVPTDRLIRAGESSGRMGVIDRWVLTTTLAWLDVNLHRLTHTNFVCVNLNGASLNDEQFLQDVYALFDQNVHLVKHLCLEITESVALQDIEITCQFVDWVRSYGAKVALDDFGAGYTSFSYLKEFTADLLKIDGSFIVDMNKHPANVAIVEAIVSLANNLGMKVIAEWAEDIGTVQTLAEIGVDYVQGWAVSKSQPPERILLGASSASFIQDEALMAYVSQIGIAAPAPTPVNMFLRRSTDQLH